MPLWCVGEVDEAQGLIRALGHSQEQAHAQFPAVTLLQHLQRPSTQDSSSSGTRTNLWQWVSKPLRACWCLVGSFHSFFWCNKAAVQAHNTPRLA